MRYPFAIPLLLIVAPPALRAQAVPSPAPDSVYVPRRAMPKGREVVAYIIGASWCVPSNQPAFLEAARRATLLLSRQARAAGAAFSAAGVALDWDPARGVAYLGKLGPLDEVTAGRNWVNTVAVDLIWRDPNGQAATPQVVLVERTVDLAERRIGVSPTRVLARLVGPEAITAWVARGAPVPEPTVTR